MRYIKILNKILKNLFQTIINNKIILTLIGSISFTFTVYPFYIWPLVFISVFCLFRIKEISKNKKELFIYGWFFGFIIYFIGFNWLINTIEIFGEMPLYISVLIFIFFSIAFGLKYSIFLWLSGVLQEKLKLTQILAFCSSIIIAELFFPELFPFHIGDTQIYNFYFIQISDVIGVKGISLLIVFISHIGYRIIFYKDYRTSFTLIIILFSIYSYGIVRVTQIKGYKKITNTINVGIIQPNTDFIPNLTREKMESILKNIFYLLESLIKENNDIGIIVLPESATPFSITNKSYYGNKLLEYFDKHKDKIFVFNEIDYDEKSRIYNTQTFYTSGNIIGKYHKIYLLPFGEYIPLSNIFSSLNEMFPQVGNFSKGNKKENFRVNDITLTPNICYEAIIPNFVRGFIREGGEIIINITNDKWFGKSSATFRHKDLLIMRAIENRVPIIRATNSGTSTIVDQTGSVIAGPTPIFTEFYLQGKINIIDDIFALYTYLGDYLLLIILILFSIHSIQKNKKIKKFWRSWYIQDHYLR